MPKRMKRPAQPVLLLNASNMETFPVYPYAFIQVPAVAREAGIEVVCKDLLGIPGELWQQKVQAWIGEYYPAMILITLRNTDSLTSQDYDQRESNTGSPRAYFPIERTKELIAAVRAVSELKIVLGGFAFSLLPKELMHYLRPDYGVNGDPDAFFAHFEDLQNGKLDQVANLLYYRRGRLVANPRQYFPPLASVEYTPQAILSMLDFYATFPSPGFRGAPVEIMRGCCHSCVFCAEPHSKGRQVRYRDPSVVMDDIQILVENGITKLYLISSELNPEGNKYILELADRIFDFNETQALERKVTWFGANYLLKFEASEFDRLSRAGFTGGWFDITALDDDNARAMRTPYRNAQLVAHLKTYAEYHKKQADTGRIQKELASSAQEPATDSRENESAVWTMFLGNPATTVETIRNTLDFADREGISGLFDHCELQPNMRVFAYEEPDESTLAATFSVCPDLERCGYQQILPSFAYPPALLSEFSEQEIMDLFDHLGQTYLSTKYQTTRDWTKFLRQSTSFSIITTWLTEMPELQEIKFPSTIRPETSQTPFAFLQKLFSGEQSNNEQKMDNANVKMLVESLLEIGLKTCPNLFTSLGFPSSHDQLERMTPYRLAVNIFSRWNTEQELFAKLSQYSHDMNVEDIKDLYIFCIKVLMYQYSIQFNQKYRELFVDRAPRQK